MNYSTKKIAPLGEEQRMVLLKYLPFCIFSQKKNKKAHLHTFVSIIEARIVRGGFVKKVSSKKELDAWEF